MTPSQQKHLEKNKISKWNYDSVTRKVAYAQTQVVDGITIDQMVVVGPRGGVRRLVRVNGGEWRK